MTGSHFSPLSRFIAGLAGYDLHLIPRYAGVEGEHERKKLVRIGAGVAIPAFLAFFTAFFFLGPYSVSVAARLAGALVVAAFIGLVDCIVVTTLSKNGGFGTLARVLISLCMGFVIAEPLLTTLFEKTIYSHIVQQLDTERVSAETRDSTELQADEEKLARLNRAMSADEVKLENYSLSNIAALHLEQSSERHDKLLSRIHATRDNEDQGLKAKRDDLLTRQHPMQDAIEKKLGEMRQESAGKRDSHTAGKGSIYSHLQGELQSLKDDQQRIEEEIHLVDTQIAAAHNDTAEETAVEAGFKRDLRASEQSDDGTLTAPERDERDRLEVEVADYKSAVAAAQREKEQVEGDLAGLPQKFALSTRNDSLAQTEALYEILTQNWFLRVKVAAIFMLLFLIDVTPVLVKLTVRTGYDEYRKSLARVDFMAAAADREAFHKLTIESCAIRTQRLTDFGASSAAQLHRLEGGPSDSPYVRSVLDQVGRAISQYTGDTIREADNVRKPERPFNLFNLVSSALMTVRAAFGTGVGLWRQAFRR